MNLRYFADPVAAADRLDDGRSERMAVGQAAAEVAGCGIGAALVGDPQLGAERARASMAA